MRNQLVVNIQSRHDIKSTIEALFCIPNVSSTERVYTVKIASMRHFVNILKKYYFQYSEYKVMFRNLLSIRIILNTKGLKVIKA